MKININSIVLTDVLLNEHNNDIDSCTFKVEKDGYYIIEHIILPNKKSTLTGLIYGAESGT